MFLIFDTETTGFALDFQADVRDTEKWPRIVQLAWQLHDETGKLLSARNFIVRPDGFTIPYNAVKIHGITTERAEKEGRDLAEVLAAFEADRKRAKYLIGHNVEFDLKVTMAEYIRQQRPEDLFAPASIDTKDVSTEFCAIPGGKGGKYKWPTLTELHHRLFNCNVEDAHDAAYDVDATARCFFELLRLNVHRVEEVPDPQMVTYEAPKLAEANFAAGDTMAPETATDLASAKKADISSLEELPFVHLHTHTQFSVLQSVSSVKSLVKKAKEYNMPAVAFSDHGNLMAAFNFVTTALNEDITPIVGCEFFVTDDRRNKSRQNNGHQTVLLAKTKKGYNNLSKLASMAYTEGFYYVPRIDKEVLSQYKEDLIALSGGLWGEVPYLILNVGETQAEEAFLWWKEQFGEDFYVELNRHGITEEDVVNETLLKFARKHGVKYVAANNTYYTEKSEARAQDILQCVKDGEFYSKEKVYTGKKSRDKRFGLPNEEFYFKSPGEMKKLFADLPEAIETIGEVVAKIERYKLKQDVLLPKYPIPEAFRVAEDEVDGGNRGENKYLRHLVEEGAKRRYETITKEIRERMDFELETIERTGYPGYFLIVQDFTTYAREQGVSVGPGRGSAAGSLVAYCIGITNIDPVKYDLLFERFLNPDRVSLPDIDIDFDDEGRQKVIDYVIQQYGANQVAQIITYGKMAAKSSVRDAGRVLEYPLFETNALAKLVPDRVSLHQIVKLEEKELAKKLQGDDLKAAMALREIYSGTDLRAEVLQQAVALEGAVRNTGIHACGVIITPTDITKLVPVALAKDSDMYCTQFDNYVVENAGLLKMDFLGLRTLTILKDAVQIIKEQQGVEIDLDAVPLDDVKTYELFQRGDTVGIFQYESAGMQKYLKELKPTDFMDLVAMNALFRPGPMEYIPTFIRRKHGEEPIEYELEESREFLEETYGVTVYQEQVMRLSQKLAGFTKGEADVLRKAMGKKDFGLLSSLKAKFLEGCKVNGHPEKIAMKIWEDWEAFAHYAFNKSHSTCYAFIGFQTAYLKANYPAAYMASVLSNNMNDIKQVTFYMEECRRMNISVLGPDVNESNYKFTVNKKGQIRFGLGAIKGVGGAAVESIIKERKQNGPYTSVFDFISRTDLRAANKRCLESLVLGGGLDCFPQYHRAQYFAEAGTGGTFLENLIKYGNVVQAEKDAPPNLFGETEMVEVQKPPAPPCQPWSNMETLRREKEMVGIYISAHPLDDFRFEIKHFAKGDLSALQNLSENAGAELALPGIVTAVEHRTTKKNQPFGTFELEDYNSNFKFFLFSEDYLKLRHFMVPGNFLFVQGKIVPRKWKENELEFSITAIELLSEIRARRTKKLVMEMNLEKVNEELIASLEKLFSGHKGSIPVELKIHDPVKQWSVRMPSRKVKIDLSDTIISELNKIDEVSYKVNA